MTTISGVTSNQAVTGTSAQQTAEKPLFDKKEFSQLMMLMMMSSLGSSSSSSSSSMFSGSSDSLSGSSGSGFNMQMLMLPLMMQLLEKMDGTNTTAATTQSTLRTEQLLAPEPSGEPVHGVLTQGYHAAHHGLDFGIPLNTEIKSTMDGKVIYSGWNNEGYGNLVIVENGAYRTYYAHLNELPLKVGDTVKRGDVVGLSGSTGNSTGPHLHYEVRVNGQTIDPTEITLSNK
jgi:lysostaphin